MWRETRERHPAEFSSLSCLAHLFPYMFPHATALFPVPPERFLFLPAERLST